MFKTLSLLIWPALYLGYSYLTFHSDSKTQKKLITNTVSATNCYTTFLLGSMYYLTNHSMFYEVSYLLNGSYFVWDTYRIMLTNFRNELPYVLHHVIGLTFFEYLDIEYASPVYKVYYLAEISNMLTYFIYHYIKTTDLTQKSNVGSLNTLLLCQTVWYGILRIPVALYFLKYKRDEFHDVIYYPCCLIFIMGAYWWVGQIKGLQTSRRKYLEMEDEPVSTKIA